MEAVVKKKFDHLESVLGQFIVSTNTSLGCLERNVSLLTGEMREFKGEIRDFKNKTANFVDLLNPPSN